MSIELEVSIQGPLVRGEVVEVISGWLAKLGWNTESLIESHTNESGPFRLRLGDEAEIECGYYEVSELAGEAEGGTWFSTTVVVRTVDSVLLLLLSAAAVAHSLNTLVLDDSQLIGSGRLVLASQILDMLQDYANRPFSVAARDVCSRLGIVFSD